MNCSNHRVWALVAMGLGVTANATAQFGDGVPFDQDFLILCDNPSTTNSNFSNPFAIVRQRTDLFAYTIGTVGTYNFELCFGNPGFVADVPGRIGFAIGRVGSIQDIAVEGTPIDDDLQLTFGMPYAPGGNWGYAKIITQTDTGARTFNNFGDGAIDGYFTGASDRYTICIDRSGGVETVLRADLIGDAARLRWQFENLDAAPRSIGLWFGQYVIALGPSTNSVVGPRTQGMDYVRVPGRQPLRLETRFSRTPQSGGTRKEYEMPDYVDFGITQSWAYGLQIINSPTTEANSALADQTPVDILDVGDAGAFKQPSLLGNQGVGTVATNDRPMSDTFFWPFDDTFFNGDNGVGASGSGYIQKWQPTAVGGANTANRFRTIVSYYKSTTGNSDYAPPYSAVVDAPRTIATVDSDPKSFNPSLATVRVYIDNTRGFSTAQQGIPLNNVRITLDLPQGMTDANNPTSNRIVQTIDRVNPNNSAVVDPSEPYAFRDFQVRIAPTVSGTQFYRVTVEPNPGAKKVITGSINVAAQPRLLVRPSANLITAPWQFTNTTWSAVLAPTLKPDIDYQAFTWDAQRQEYVLQTGPQRGKGTFLVSKRDAGFVELNGNPRTPDDLATGADLIQLRPGWNLIANPYNYPIEIGQIVGVSATDPSRSQTYEELAAQNIVSSSLAYWDQNTQSYKFTTNFASELLPNRGYWVFVSTNQDVTLKFPAVFTPFIPRGTGGIQNSGGWMLNLVARTAKGLDDQNFIGTAQTQAQVNKLRVLEPPIAPLPNAVRANLLEGNTRLATSLRLNSGTTQWVYEITPRGNDNVTLTWPTLNQVPANIKLTLIDEMSDFRYDMRTQSSVTFFGTANVPKRFKILAEDVGNIALISNLTANSTASTTTFKYTLSGSATTSIRVLQSGREIRNLVSNRSESAGDKSVVWNLLDAANRRVRSGVYAVEVKVKNSAGKSETKTISFLVR